MSTHDLDIANQTGSPFRTDLNNALKALGTLMSNPTAPSLTPALGQVWLDTTSSPYKLMIYNGTQYVEMFRFTSGGSPVVTMAGVGTVLQGYDANTAKINAVQTWTKQQHFNGAVAGATLTDATTIAWNLDDAQVANVTLGGNRTMGAPTNLKNGGIYVIRVKQDATGGRTLAWNAVFKFGANGTPTITATANAMDILTFVCDGTNLYLTGLAQGF